jgi:hypothetical protein
MRWVTMSGGTITRGADGESTGDNEVSLPFHLLDGSTKQVPMMRHGLGNDFDYDLYNKNVPEEHESHGIKGLPTYVSGAGLDSATRAGNFQLAKTSAGYDAGELIPNFSDGYTGAAPDMGAHENGWDDMKFGVNAVFVLPIVKTESY